MTTRLILNGKKAGQEDVRAAVYSLRASGHNLEVRTTWESGDVERLVKEAVAENVTRIIAGGGDGTVNEVTNALFKHQANHIELAILPLGTANDFASACEIPLEPISALELAINGDSYWVDSAKANDMYFINIATAGFGAQVTATTPVALKDLLGGGAYTLSGLVQAIKFEPFAGKVTTDGIEKRANIVVGAVCNGRTAGGGQPLAPRAYIDDGLLDTFSIEAFGAADVPKVIEELNQDQVLNEPIYIKRAQATKIDWLSTNIMPINLDGEPISVHQVTIEVVPNSVKLILPSHTQVLLNRKKA